MSDTEHNARFIRRETLVLLCLVGFGAWLRLRHLGDLGLIVDEGNQALAVRGWLEHGVPRVESGALYLRGPAFLGVQTLAAWLLGLDEFTLRLPSALFGVAGILASYALAARLFGSRVAVLTAAIVTFSVWEIELSRYGRFYTAFQCVFLVALLFFYRGFMQREQRYRLAFVAATLVAFTLHEFSVLLATCFAIPLVSSAFTARQKVVALAQGAVLAGAWALYRRLGTAVGGASQAAQGARLVEAEAGAVETARVAFGVPRLRLPDSSFLVELASGEPWLLALVGAVPAAATAYLVFRALRGSDGLRVPIALLMVGAALAHQFTLVAILWVGYTASFARGLGSLWEPPLRATYAAIASSVVFWLAYLAFYAELSGRQLVMATFGFPNVLQYFAYWLVKGWPMLTAVGLASCAVLMARFVSNRDAPMPLFILAVVFLQVVVTSFFRAFFESRYVFHLYPLLVMICAWAACEVAPRAWQLLLAGSGWRRGIGATGLTAIALLIAEDANPVDAWEIGDRTYASSRDPLRSVISWTPYAGFHQDRKTPSEYVLSRLGPEDRVVAMGPPHAIGVYHFYVRPVDYAVGRPGDLSYYRQVGGKLVGWVTASEILLGPEALRQVLDDAPGCVWLLVDRLLFEADNEYYPEESKKYVRSLVREPDYVGLDGHTLAVRLRGASRTRLHNPKVPRGT